MKPCPVCGVRLKHNALELLAHYASAHGRNPTEGEAYRFRNPLKPSKRAYKAGYRKSGREVSGGLPS